MSEKKIIPRELTTDEFELISEVKSEGKTKIAVLYDRVCRRKVFMKSGDADIIENEARMLAHFGGEGVPELYGCFGCDGRTYLLRRYIEGQNLYERTENDGKFSPAEAAEIGIKLCKAVSRLHSSTPPVVHRDIKPENVIITDNGEIFLVDLGIAREYDENSSRDTQVMGTLSAAPPEQFGYGQTDERSDVYSIGVLLREITAGSPGKRLGAVINKCTAFAPEQRYRNASEVCKALEKLRKKPFPKAAAMAAAMVLLTASAYAIGINSSPVPDAGSVEAAEAMDYVPEIGEDGKVTVPLDGVYAGDWNYAGRIPKSALDIFGGDVTVKLEIETLPPEKPGEFSQIRPVFAHNRWGSPDYSTDNNLTGNDGWVLLGSGQTTFTFQLTHEVIRSLEDSGLDFTVYDVVLKSAAIKPAAGAGFITLDNEYLGDYELSTAIPRSELKKIGGDIKITLVTEIEGLYNYANFMPIALSGEDNVWTGVADMIEYSGRYSADGEYLELDNGQTECSFILSQEALDLMNENGLVFRAVNVTIRSAQLEKAENLQNNQ